MSNRKATMKFTAILIQCILLFLMLLVQDNHATSPCYNMADILIAVDTTSSLTESDFKNVKTELKKIVAGFTITEPKTRLGLISISNQVLVISNLNSVNSMELNTAIDKLGFSIGNAKLSEGIRVAKESILANTKSGDAKRTKVLILVKDRRSTKVYGSAELISITSEAAGLKSVGAAIHAVGIGGLWNQQELESLFGTEYLLFKNMNLIGSVKSLNNRVCIADCPRNGEVAKKEGLCYNGIKHQFFYKIALTNDNSGKSVCRTAIEKKMESCNEANGACSKRNRMLGPCENDKLTVVNQWDSFDPKLQSCVKTDVKNVVKCVDAHQCTDQVADIMFILDKSGSMGPNYTKVIDATRILADSLYIGPDNVRVGLITYSTESTTDIPLGSAPTKAEVLNKIDKLSKIPGGSTMTNQSLADARIALSGGRQDVQKYAFILTDGASTNPRKTFLETRKLKEAGITLFAIGIGNIKKSELEAMTAPETSTNMFIFETFDDMVRWTKTFSETLCIQLASPIPKLCDDSVFLQTISGCVGGKQLAMRTEYKYNAIKKCIKTFMTTEYQNCRSKCWDPINGNEYFEGDVWESFCYKFQCKGNGVAEKMSEKCRAADGSCWNDGTGPFQCLNDLGKQFNNCYCIPKATIVTDTI